MMTSTENVIAGPALSAYQVEFESKPADVKAGEVVDLVFTIRNANGLLMHNLEIVHEQAMHLLVVSEDLSEFHHLHPEQQTDGRFRVTHTFPQAGNYRLYVDYTPIDTHQIVNQLSLQVLGKARESIALIEDELPTKTVNGIRVTMRANQPLRAGEGVLLDFVVEDEQTHEPVTDLQPYLGALAHFVIISEDGAEFLHVHPMEHHGASAAHHSDHAVSSSTHQHTHSGELHSVDTITPQISAHTSFPRAGLYKTWAQLQRDGQVITVPFVVRIAEQQTYSS
ncbi:hypothetical protein ABN584_19895 [Gloeocapsa sp. BRSZ]